MNKVHVLPWVTDFSEHKSDESALTTPAVQWECPAFSMGIYFRYVRWRQGAEEQGTIPLFLDHNGPVQPTSENRLKALATPEGS